MTPEKAASNKRLSTGRRQPDERQRWANRWRLCEGHNQRFVEKKKSRMLNSIYVLPIK